MAYKNLDIETRDGISVVTINRPKVLNALNFETMGELAAAFASLARDGSVRGIVVTGAGEKAFVAGADIKELERETPESGHESSIRGQSVFRQIEAVGKPVVAAVNGFALGGGLELALACHMRIAAEEAKMGLPEVKLGAMPGYGGTQRLGRLIGKGRALQMILTGEPIDAAEAYRIGLVNRVVPRGELLEAARALLQKVLRNGPLAVRNALIAVDRGLDGSSEEGLALEASLFGVLCGTEDLREGMRAFLEKRPAEFKGK
ncbi:MAG: enoyl-CoA hydratase/isomerase family protein [Acidobacteriota bacterium]